MPDPRETGAASPAGARWLLLIHQIPPKPDYFRVKVRRRLQRIGAVPLKSSVYVLPCGDETLEDFQWLAREIVADGGEATLCEAIFLEGVTDAEIQQLFHSARDQDYRGIAAAAHELARGGDAERTAAELPRLMKRLGEVAAVDFLGAPARREAEDALAEADRSVGAARRGAEPGARAAPGGRVPRGSTWVTRRGVYVDRIASAWLIRRFLDPEARFVFVDPKSYRPRAGELRFDMFDAEYTHEGDSCTFETLLARLGGELARDRALRAIAEIVHDIDCKDEKFGREEAAGVASLLTGIAGAHDDDAVRIERGAALFDDLYASFARGRP